MTPSARWLSKRVGHTGRCRRVPAQRGQTMKLPFYRGWLPLHWRALHAGGARQHAEAGPSRDTSHDPPFFLLTTCGPDDVLPLLRRNRQHLAIIRDAAGKVCSVRHRREHPPQSSSAILPASGHGRPQDRTLAGHCGTRESLLCRHADACPAVNACGRQAFRCPYCDEEDPSRDTAQMVVVLMIVTLSVTRLGMDAGQFCHTVIRKCDSGFACDRLPPNCCLARCCWYADCAAPPCRVPPRQRRQQVLHDAC